MTHYQAFPVLTAPLIDRKSVDPTPSSVGDTDDRQLLLKSEQPATVSVRVSGRPRPRVTWSVGSTTLATDDFGTAVLPSGVESPDSYVSLPTYRYALNVERVTDDWERRGGLTIQASNDLGTDTLTLPVKLYKVLCGKSSSPYRRESGGRHVRRLGSHTTVDSASAGGNGSVRSGTKSPSPAPSKRKDLSKYSWTVEDWTSWHKEMEARSRMRSIDDILDSDHEDDDEPSGQSANSQRQQPPQTTAFPYNPVVRANCHQTDIDSLTDVTSSTIGKLATASETELTSTTTSSLEFSSTSLVPPSDSRAHQRQQVTSTLTSSVGPQNESLSRTLPPPAPPRTISRLSTASNSASESEDCRKPVPVNIPANEHAVPSALDGEGPESQQSTEIAPNWSKVGQDHPSQSVRPQENEAGDSSWQLFGSRLSEVCRQLLTDDIKDSRGNQTNVSGSILKENRQQVVDDNEAASESRDQKSNVGENTLCPVTPDSTAFRQQRPPSPASDLVISGPIPVVTYTLSSADLMYTSASSSFPRDLNRSPLIAPKTKPIVPAKPSVKSPRQLPLSAPSTPGTAEFVAQAPPLDTAMRREINDRPVCSNKPVVPPKPPVAKKPSISGRGSCNPTPPESASPRIASVDFRPQDLPPVSVRIIRKNDTSTDITQTKRKSETDLERKPDVAARMTTTIFTEASQNSRSLEMELVRQKTAIPAFGEPVTSQRPPKTCISLHASDHPLQRRQSEATPTTKFPRNPALKTSKSNEDLLNGICGQKHFSLSKSSSGSIAPACIIAESGREKIADQLAFVGKDFILSDACTVSRSPASSVSGTVGRRRTLSREWEVTWTTTQEEIITVVPNSADDVSISSSVVADSSSPLNTSLTTQTATSTQTSGYRTAVDDLWLINAQAGGNTFASSSSLPTQPDACSNNPVSRLDHGKDRLASSEMNRSWSMRNESLTLLSQPSAGKPGGRIKVQFPVGSGTEEVPTGAEIEAKTSSRVLDDLIDALTEIALAAATQEAEQQRPQIQQQMQTVSTWSR